MEKRKKTKELSEDLRSKFVRKHMQSQGYKSISKDLNVPVSIVCSVIKKFKAHGTVANFPRCGRKRKIDERFQRKIVRMVDKEPRLTSKQVQAALQSKGKTVSTRTIRRRLNEKGLYGRIPFLWAETKSKKTDFAQNQLWTPWWKPLSLIALTFLIRCASKTCTNNVSSFELCTLVVTKLSFSHWNLKLCRRSGVSVLLQIALAVPSGSLFIGYRCKS
ncbi:hypothetical protein NFI96_006380 [Prochilodus magdalenae]|nr:hypothetical protein NFI96_006380 [Prochilodus magdalenae]